MHERVTPSKKERKKERSFRSFSRIDGVTFSRIRTLELKVQPTTDGLLMSQLAVGG